jgi:hypothetical protein
VTTAQGGCPHGHAVGTATAFCPQCGVPLPAPSPAAPTCPYGHVAGPTDSYCRQCGTPLALTTRRASPATVPYPPLPPGYLSGGSGVASYAPGGALSAPRPTSGLAIASLVLSVVWFWWITSIVGLVLGIVALRQIKERDLRGRGLAIAGIAISSLALVSLLIVFVVAIASSSSASTSSMAL